MIVLAVKVQSFYMDIAGCPYFPLQPGRAVHVAPFVRWGVLQINAKGARHMETATKTKKKAQRKMKKAERPEVLNGFTYKIKAAPNGLGDNINLYVTINNDSDGKIRELFIDVSDRHLYEWLTVLSRFASAMLQLGIPVMNIIDELSQIHSDSTSHFIPGSQGTFCTSLAARIGVVIKNHYMQQCP